ncbi:MAG: YeeE/YedE thiosulfate transporter family protein [Burkholderiales bacterium]
MTIAWNLFTPWHALAGGLLIGLASALYVLGNGRIAGIAGIVASPLRALLSGTGMAPERTRLVFIGGLLIAPWIWRLFAPLPVASVDVGTVGLIAAGLFVGVGARLGNGCTSGHGVCGLSRLSLRSLVNVMAFMAAGFATVYLLRHVR